MARKNFKQLVVSIPILGYCMRLVSNIVKLPKTNQVAVEARDETTRLLQTLNHQLTEQADLSQQQYDDLQDNIASLERAQDELRQRSTTKERSSQKDPLFADDHLMDKFYKDFEDRFRGTEEMIMERQKEYLPYFSKTDIDFKKAPILDIGSGRGEFIQLLKKQGIAAVGLDINLDMVKRAKEKGLNSEQGDALSFLQSKDSQSYGAITGFHIVEHIPFNALMRIFKNAHRVLVKGGFVIFETPNPENIVVSGTTFYLDPSHLHPLPPVLLSFALETCGFKNIDILRLHPDDKKATEKLPKEIQKLIYGARDYAVIGYK